MRRVPPTWNKRVRAAVVVAMRIPAALRALAPRLPRASALGAAVLLCFAVLPWMVSRALAPSRQLKTVAPTAYEPPRARVPALTVASWNLAHGRGLAEGNWEGGDTEERARRLEAIADRMRSLDADVFVLNEVDFDSSWSSRVDQAQYLAEELGYPWRAEVRNLDFAVGPLRFAFGNVVLSRFPILEARVVDLPAHAEWEAAVVGKKRGLDVTLDVGGGEALRVLAVHLEHRREAARVAAAELLSDLLLDEDLPTVVVGDLNSSPPGPGHQRAADGSNALEVLVEAGDLRGGPGAPTFPADDPRWPIDWVLTTSDLERGDDRVHPTLLSDHLPISTRLGLPGARRVSQGVRPGA